MTEEDISIVQEDLARDLYEMATSHREEITRVMEEFDAHDIDTSVKLDGYERKRWQLTAELGAPRALVAQPPQTNDTDNNVNVTDTKHEQEEEPSPFNILQDDDDEQEADDNEDNPKPTSQEYDITVGSTVQGTVPRVCHVLAGRLPGVEWLESDECEKESESKLKSINKSQNVKVQSSNIM